MGKIVALQIPVRRHLVCSLCGADGEGSCNCGASYVPAGQRAADAISKNPGKSDRAIAEEIGVSDQTVGRARRRTATPVAVTKRTGKDGKRRKMPRRKPKPEPPADVIIQEPCMDCNSEEERWQRSLSNLAGDAISMPAFWTREFGRWDQFDVSSDLITLAEQAAASWQQLIVDLKKRRKAQ